MKKVTTLILSISLLVGVGQAHASMYKIEKGDTLYNIARIHGMTVDQIKQSNRLISDDIKVGQQLSLSATTTPDEVTQTNPIPEKVSRNGDMIEQRLQNVITSLVGTPYKWGGTSTAGFDCSGFTMHTMGQLGVKLPRMSGQQFHGGVAVDRDQLEPGDLLFFDSAKSGKITHVSIYMGNNRMAHAATKGIVIEDATWYFKNYPYHGAKRML